MNKKPKKMKTAPMKEPRRRRVNAPVERAVVDDSLISSLPDSIIQHILSLIPIKFAIRTCVLSTRWVKVWRGVPSISLDCYTLPKASSSRFKTLVQYNDMKMKMKRLHLQTGNTKHIRHVNTWIDLAMSGNVENMLLEIAICNYSFPDSFYVNSSVKQMFLDLSLGLSICNKFLIIPSVSWTSLNNLSLRGCDIPDESMAKILAGCPVLESLRLVLCVGLRLLDLTSSPSVKTLEVVRRESIFWVDAQLQIVAPHIQCLILTNSMSPCTLVNVTSLTEAKLNIFFLEKPLKADFIEAILKTLEKLHNVEQLAFGANFLKVFSPLELCAGPFPVLKVKSLILEIETILLGDTIPQGIQRLLRNSTDLKKLTVHTRTYNTKPDLYNRSGFSASFMEGLIKSKRLS